MQMLSPKTVSVTDGDGNERSFIIHKFPAVQGFEINARYPVSLAASALPKIGDWKLCEELQKKILRYVAVENNNQLLFLETDELVNNHVGDWESMAKVIALIMNYNNSFFRNGTISDFFAGIVQQAITKFTETLSQSSEQLLKKAAQHSTNSEQSTH